MEDLLGYPGMAQGGNHQWYGMLLRREEEDVVYSQGVNGVTGGGRVLLHEPPSLLGFLD
jgi:hypothetical protein